MIRQTLLATLIANLLAPAHAHEHHTQVSDTAAPPFSAHFYVDALAYERSKDLSVQEALGIYNVHGGHEEGAGHSHGGTFREGLSINNAEAHFAMRFPGWVDGRLNLGMSSDGLELEEAWLRTQFLPAGFSLKGGKFLSDIGAQNKLHPHAWDFVDQSLPYQMLFGGSLSGTGAQLHWQSDTALQISLGSEFLTGANDGVAAYLGSGALASNGQPVRFAEKGNWPNVWTAFAKVGGEIAPNHQMRGGFSWVSSDLHQELHTYHPGINDAEHGLQGKANAWGVFAGYTLEGHGDEGAGELRLLAEYWSQNKDLYLSYHELKPQLTGQPRDLTVDALSLQALYGIAPRWTLGVRYDQAGMTHEASRAAATVGPTNTSYFDPVDRISGVLTWVITEQHQLRLQLSRVNGTFAQASASGKDIASEQS